MSFTPQNFVDQVGPPIKAAWLNELDQTVINALQAATTVAQIQLILGIPSGGLSSPITILQGGTGQITAGAALTALGGTTLAAVNQAYIGSQLYPQTPAESTAGVTPVATQYPELNILRYGAINDGTTDNTTAIANARAVLAVNGGRLVVPSGVYAYATGPNWAIPNAQIIGYGWPTFKHTGTQSAAFILDGGVSSGTVYRMLVDGLIIQGNTNNTNGIFIRSVHHSNFRDIKVTGCNAAGAGLLTNFMVANTFERYTCSTNEGTVITPTFGMVLDKRGAGESTAYCTFIDTICEGLTTGIRLNVAQGCNFLGGTSEGNSAFGVDEQATSSMNVFEKMDFEVNSNSDVLLRGRGSTMINCDSNNLIQIYGAWNEIRGGFHSAITINTGSVSAALRHLEFNRNASGAIINDGGTGTVIDNVRDATGPLANNKYPAPPTAAAGQTVTASPYTYTNNTGVNQSVIVAGGVVTLIQLVRQAVSINVGTTAGMFLLSPSDGLTVTYTGLPTVVSVTRS
jgi:hypothetical protein